MKRTARMQRIRTLLEAEERRTRLAVGQANLELAAATAAVEDVMAQCRRLAEASSGTGTEAPGAEATGNGLPVAAAAAVLRSGWLESQERQARERSASQAAEERRTDWQEANRRQDAVGRVADRWREADEAVRRRAEAREMDDVVAAVATRRNREAGAGS